MGAYNMILAAIALPVVAVTLGVMALLFKKHDNKEK